MPKELKPLTDWNFKMKVVKDLGMKKPTENYYKKVRMALFECSNCKSHFASVVSKKAESQLFCKDCNGVSNKKSNRSHKLYRIWADTKTKLKCTNSHRIAYLDKNITMCDEWLTSFDSFYEWAIHNGYQDGLTIDRIDNNGNYEPSNCRWVDWSVQMVNQRPVKANNTTGYKGITKITDTKWVAHIKFRHKSYGLGTYKTAIEAAKAYDSFVKIMNWPHSTNNLLKPNEVVFPTNKTTVKYLSSIGIHESDFMSKES